MSAPSAELTASPAAITPTTRTAIRVGPLAGGRLYLVLAALALVIAAFSLLLPSTPSYDPWAWLVWGREIVHLKLHTSGGPSWKPLPVIFTTLFAPFGKAAPDLWLVIARAGAVMAVAMSFKVAWRLTRELVGGPAEATGAVRMVSILPVLLASVIAAGSLVNSRGFISDNALGYSEGLMTALVLVALDRHLDGARRQAFAVGFFAALDRPELWLLWGPYGVYLWLTDRDARKLVLGLFALIPVVWFLPELWGSGHLFRGVTRAQHPRSNSAAFAHCPFCTEFAKHAWPTVLLRVKVPALIAMAVAALGLVMHAAGRAIGRVRARVVLLGAGLIGFGWWSGIAVETQAGFSGNDRYLVLGAALVSIVGGVAWGWAAGAVADALRRLRSTGLVAAPAGTATAIAVFLVIPPWIGKNIINLPRTHRALVYQAHLRQDAARAVRDLGGPSRILRCGTIMTEGFQVPMLAWTLGVHTSRIEASPLPHAPLPPAPNVIFQTRAQRKSSLLPVVRAWQGVPYRRVAHVRTFRVYSNCRDKVAL